MKINPEILSNKATHTYKGIKVKVFKSVVPGYNGEGKLTSTAEIMEGEDHGKWTTVELDALTPIGGGK